MNSRPAPGRRMGWLVSLLGVGCIAGIAWAWWVSPHRVAEATVRGGLRELRESHGCTQEYSAPNPRPWQALAKADLSASMTVFWHLQRQNLKVCPEDMEMLIGIALGVDHDGRRSRAFLTRFILPGLQTEGELPGFVRAMLESPRLRVPPDRVPRIFELWLRRIEDGRQVEIFHERSHPTSFPTLDRWARELVAQSAVKEARGFFPRLLALLKKHRTAAAGTLNTLAPLLTPDENFIALATALDVHAGFGLYGDWCLGALLAHAPPARLKTLIPTVLGDIERSIVRNPRNEDVNRFGPRGEVLAEIADHLDPVGRKQLALDALALMAKAKGEDRPAALAMALLRVLGPLDRGQVAPVLRPWLAEWPERMTQTIASQLVFVNMAEHAAVWLQKADPEDLSRAAFHLRDRLLAGGPGSVDIARAFAGWAPLVSPSDAFAIAMPLAAKMATWSNAHGVVALSTTVEKFGQRLASRQALAIARTIAPRWQSTCAPSTPCDADARWVRHWLTTCMRSLVLRMDDADHRVFVARWDLPPAETKAPIVDEEPHFQVDQEYLRDISKNSPWPSAKNDPSGYLHTWFGFWLGHSVSRAVLIRALDRSLPSGVERVHLSVYAAPVSPAQLYLDLLKDYRTDGENWNRLIPMLRKAAQQPTTGSLWDLLAWSKSDPAGRALGLDVASPPPW